MIKVVLELGADRIVYDADDRKEAPAIACNLLAMLRAGWRLKVEAEAPN